MDKLDIERTLESLHTYPWISSAVSDDENPPVITTEHESHCGSCFNTRKCRKLNFSRANSPNIQCKIVMCQYNCGQEFHECKLDEHQHLCSNVKVNCINAVNGCPLVMERRLIATHLEKCPASVVVCNSGWYRKILDGENSIELEKNQLGNILFLRLCEIVAQNDFDFASHLENLEFLRRDERVVEEWRDQLPQLLSNSVQIALRCKHPGILFGPSGKHNLHFITSENVAEVATGSDTSTNRSSSGWHETVFNKKATSGKGENHTKCDYSDGGIKLKPDATSLNPNLTKNILAMQRINGFSFMCGREFRRDEYAGHYDDVHNTVLPHFNRLLFSQCPMRGHGCSFFVDRIFPLDNNHRIVYNDEVEAFWTTQIQSDITETERQTNETDNIEPRNICDIPFELLLLITRYLDPMSLSCLSMTCSLMKEVCASVVVRRGIVVFQWEKKPNNKGWEVIAKNWKFSTSFSPIRKWSIVDVDLIYNHIQSCPCNDRRIAEAPFNYNVTLDNIASFEKLWDINQEKSYLRLNYGIIKSSIPHHNVSPNLVRRFF